MNSIPTNTSFSSTFRTARQFRGALFLAACLLGAGKVSAVDVIKADTVDNLDQAAAWVSGVPPTSADIAIFDSTLSVNSSWLLGTDTNWLGISVSNPAVAPSIQAGSTLTLGASGIDMANATQNFAMTNAVVIGATQTWNVASGRSLGVAGSVDGTSLIKDGAGVLDLYAGNIWTNGTIVSNGVIALDATVATLGVNTRTNTLTFMGGAISNNWGTGNQVNVNNDINVATGATATIYMGNRIRLGSSGSGGSTITGGGTLNLINVSTVTRDDVGSQCGAFTGTFNCLGTGGMRWFINAGFHTGWSNAVVNMDGPQAHNFNCNSFGNNFAYGALNGTNTGTQVGFTSAGGLPRLIVGQLNQDMSFVGQFVANVSLNKVGTGSLTLTANHTTTATNAVSGGRQIWATGGSFSNSLSTTVQDTAGIGIKASPGNPRYVVTNLTFSTGATILEFNFGGSTASATDAPLLVTGNLTLFSTTTLVGLVGGGWAVGQYPLIKYTGTLSGSAASLTLTNQPARVLGYLSNNTANASIDYVVTNTTQPLSWATGSGDWDISTTSNWKDSAGATTTYQETSGVGDAVQFENTYSGTSPITVTLNTAVVPSSVTHNSTKNFTISGTGDIGGSASLTKQGSGTLTLTTANSFTGGANVNGGILNFSSLGNLGGASSPISFGGGTLQYASGNTADISSRTVTFNSGGATIDIGGNSVTFAARVGNNGTGGLTKTGAGTLTLSGANNYSGNTTISQDTLTLASGASISNSPVITVSSGTTLDVSASGIVLNGAVSQTLGGSGTVIGNVTAGTGSSLAPGTSPGTLTLGNDLTINGGTYVFDVATNSALDLISVAGNLALTSGTIQVVSGTALTNGTYKLIQYSGTLSGAAGNLIIIGFTQPLKIASLSDATPGQIDLVVQGVGGANLTWAGSGADWDVALSSNWLQIATSVVFSNGDFVTFNDGGAAQANVNLAATVLPSAATVGSATDYIFSTTGSGKIGGVGAVTNNGPGKLTVLTANNTTGPTAINGGTVQVGDGATTGDLGTGDIIDNGSLVFAQTDNRSVAGTISGTGSLVQQGTAVLTLTKNSTYSGPTTISSGTLQVGNGGATGTLGSGAVTNVGALIVNRSGTLTVANGITGTGTPSPATLTKLGTGTLTLGGVNTYEGNTYISNGIVKLGASGVIPDGGATTGWLILDGGASAAGTLDLNGFDETVNALSGTGGTVLGRILNDGGTGTNTLRVSCIAATTYAGTILNNSGSGGQVALFKDGANTLTLSGASSFSAGTTVASGTLTLGNTTGAGAGSITMSNGTTLAHAGLGGNTVGNNIITPAGATATFTVDGITSGYNGSFFSGDGNSTNSIAAPMSMSANGTKQFQNFTGTVRIESGGQIRYSSTSLSVNGGDNTTFEVLGTLNTRNGSGNGQGIAVGALTGNGIVAGAAVGTPGVVRMNIGAKGLSTEFTGQINGVTPVSVLLYKLGAGTLTLSGTLAYDGTTTVSNGVLVITGATANLDVSTNISVKAAGVLDVSGIVSPAGTLNLGNTVAQSLAGAGTVWGSVVCVGSSVATIAPGDSIGTLTVTNAVTFAANTAINMEVNRTNSPTSDRLAAQSFSDANGATIIVTNIGPTPFVDGDTFQLFSQPVSGFTNFNLPALPITQRWVNKLAVNGTLEIEELKLDLAIIGGSIYAAWPLAPFNTLTNLHLEAQTNTAGGGLTATWYVVPGSDMTNLMVMPVDPANGSVYYRLNSMNSQ